MADFLVALAGFDRRRGWETLGHATLFAFLNVELRLSRSAAFYRKTAAELLQAFPEVIEPLRDGRLCLSSIAELAKVVTKENRAVVTPRFFGLSARESQELVAELQPRQVPSTRMVVTRVLDRSAPAPTSAAQPVLTFATAAASAFGAEAVVAADTYPKLVPPSRGLTSELANGGGGRGGVRRDEITPLTADLRRIHFNVGKQVVRKLEAAREGLSHSIRGATMEQVLESALDLLLEKQARARVQVKKPRKTVASTVALTSSHSGTQDATPNISGVSDVLTSSTPTPAPAPALALAPTPTPPPLALIPTEPPPPRRTGPRETIPAAVRRAVWERDQGRCTWPLDSGGCCGSTHRLELDHIDPWARWGGPTEANLRLVCAFHNALAARREFGARWMGRYQGGRRVT